VSPALKCLLELAGTKLLLKQIGASFPGYPPLLESGEISVSIRYPRVMRVARGVPGVGGAGGGGGDVGVVETGKLGGSGE
jgi:hypothetical protein